MRKKLAPEEGPRPPSRYTLKVRNRLAGIRPEFEFIDQPRRPKGTPRHEESRPVRSIAKLDPSKYPQTVLATVTNILPDRYCMFLSTANGESLYLGFNVIHRDLQIRYLEWGAKIRCEIEPHSRGRGLRVIKIFEICSPEEN